MIKHKYWYAVVTDKVLMVTLFPSSPSLVGTCGQAYWLSWVYFLMFTVRIWIKSNCLHCVVFGKKVWKKGKQGHCPKLCRQWFLPCPDCDLLLLFYWNSLQLIPASTDSLSKGNIIQTKGAEGKLSAHRRLQTYGFVSPFFGALEFIVRGVVGHCLVLVSGQEGQQLLADRREAALQVGHSRRLVWAF